MTLIMPSMAYISIATKSIKRPFTAAHINEFSDFDNRVLRDSTASIVAATLGLDLEENYFIEFGQRSSILTTSVTVFGIQKSGQ